MKKTFLAVLRMLVLGALMTPIVSCEADETQVEVIPTITVPQGYKNYFSSSGSDGMSFESSSSENFFVFQINVDWDIRIYPSTSWCNVSTDSGKAGLNRLKVSVKKNNNGVYREATIYVEHEGKTLESIEIQQKCDDAIDLGLSVKWASRNVGASTPTEYGGYYAWGETEEKDDYSKETYRAKDVDNGSSLSICGTDYDVAHVKWGDGWRMPTSDEIFELKRNCSFNGNTIIGPNGNYIILPSTGYRDGKKYRDTGIFYFDGWADPWIWVQGGIWSGTKVYEGNILYTDCAQALWLPLTFNGIIMDREASRYLGLSVRPVKE